MKTHTKLVAVLILAAWPSVGFAQIPPVGPSRSLSTSTTAFGVRSMDFDLWCQQTQRYPAERCAARRPEDVRAFEAYRSSIERYELDYLKQVEKDQQIRARTNRDPTQTVSGKQDGLP